MFHYCDFIADTIKRHLTEQSRRTLIGNVGPVRLDLHPEQGYLQSSKKTVELTDLQGTRYRVTIEALEDAEVLDVKLADVAPEELVGIPEPNKS